MLTCGIYLKRILIQGIGKNEISRKQEKEERMTNTNKGKQYIYIYIYILCVCVSLHPYAYSYTYSTRGFNNFCAMDAFQNLMKPTDFFSEKNVFTSMK